jgi:methionine aminopeptidase
VRHFARPQNNLFGINSKFGRRKSYIKKVFVFSFLVIIYIEYILLTMYRIASRIRVSPAAPRLSNGVAANQSFATNSSVGVAAAAVSFDDSKYDRNASIAAIRKRIPVQPFLLSVPKTVPAHISRPLYADTGTVPFSMFTDTILLHDEESIAKMRHAARLARRVLDLACSLAQPGVITDDIDTAVHNAIIAAGAYPSPLNYVGFPKSLCSSINEIICHGIPDRRPLQLGDVVSFDVSNFLNGVHGDNCATVIVGDHAPEIPISSEAVAGTTTDWRGVPYRTEFESPEQELAFVAARRLVHATRESLYAAIEAIGPGACLTDVGGAIQEVGDAYGYSTIQKYRGHGIGTEFHCAPFVKVRQTTTRVNSFGVDYG